MLASINCLWLRGSARWPETMQGEERIRTADLPLQAMTANVGNRQSRCAIRHSTNIHYRLCRYGAPMGEMTGDDSHFNPPAATA